jgi:hypothetical protein
MPRRLGSRARPSARTRGIVEAAMPGDHPFRDRAVDPARAVGRDADPVPALGRLPTWRAGEGVGADLDVRREAARPRAVDIRRGTSRRCSGGATGGGR